MRNTRTWRIAITIIALILVVAAWKHFSGGASPSFGKRMGLPPTTVGVAQAAYTDIPLTLDALGTVTAAATVTVHAQVSGVLKKIAFQDGQIVQAGQILAQIDPQPFEMALAQANGQRLRDEAQLDAARILLERDRTLLTQDSIARQDVDTQAALVKQLEGSVKADRAAESSAKINLGYTTITAPVGGRLGLRAVDAGNIITPSDAAGLVTITQITPIYVVFSIPQDQIPSIQNRLAEKQVIPAIALDRNRTNTLDTGNFMALDNQIDPQTGTVKAKATFSNKQGLLFPNQFVNLRLQLGSVAHAITVPISAIRHTDQGDFVYVLNASQNTVSKRPITRGHATVDLVEVTSGLSVGETVITEGADRLKDGSPVVLPSATGAPHKKAPRSKDNS